MMKPITIGDQKFSSGKQASLITGLTESAISRARSQNRLDTVGKSRGISVEWAGNTYTSITSLAKAAGVSKQYVARLRAEGKLHLLKSRSKVENAKN